MSSRADRRKKARTENEDALAHVVIDPDTGRTHFDPRADGADWAEAFDEVYARHRGDWKLDKPEVQDEKAAKLDRRAQAYCEALSRRSAEAFARLSADYARDVGHLAKIRELRNIRAEDPGLYAYLETRAEKGDRGARDIIRHSRLVAENWGKKAAAERAITNALNKARIEVGYVHDGGEFGNGYGREPFTYQGFVSDEHPILRLFNSILPRVKKFRGGRTKEDYQSVRSKLLGADLPYASVNRDMRSLLRVDLDRTYDSAEALLGLINSCAILAPNLIVGYVDRQGRFVHPQAYWLLADAACWMSKGEARFRFKFDAVKRGLNAALLPIGADPCAIWNDTWIKNALSPLWSCTVGAQVPYSLEVLGENLNLIGFGKNKENLALLKAATPDLRGAGPVPVEHPDPEVQAGSQPAFRILRAVALDSVASYADGNGGTHGVGREAFEEFMIAQARRINPHGSITRVESQGASVAKYVWKEHAGRKQKAADAADAREIRNAARRKHADATGVHRARKSAGQTSATKRRTGSVRLISAAAIGLIGDGDRPTKAAVTRALDGKVVLETVKRNWSDAMTSLVPLCDILDAAHAHVATGGKLPGKELLVPVIERLDELKELLETAQSESQREAAGKEVVAAEDELVAAKKMIATAKKAVTNRFADGSREMLMPPITPQARERATLERGAAVVAEARDLVARGKIKAFHLVEGSANDYEDGLAAGYVTTRAAWMVVGYWDVVVHAITNGWNPKMRPAACRLPPRERDSSVTAPIRWIAVDDTVEADGATAMPIAGCPPEAALPEAPEDVSAAPDKENASAVSDPEMACHHVRQLVVEELEPVHVSKHLGETLDLDVVEFWLAWQPPPPAVI
ncbi:conserved protein of unknown function [Rhodovastum atsumiense]|uniref:Uncharacterized protein n=1 Tax=Rhodovastum atsumiense TaxID=504468 RepID=A0A5M6IIG5_9PROT|nr:hypothetical protein [Rhodovastum atsumiense]KAA5608053.1 hypothetical protein F1189_30940 [Rhodovastum atsumiense]CAH2603464.1 conserved protein of unknown function [Rhodovastum atsumiense]